MEANIKSLVHEAVFKATVQSIRADAKDLRDRMRLYQNATTSGLRDASLFSGLTKAKDVFNYIDSQGELRPQLISAMVPVAHLHLGLERERALFGDLTFWGESREYWEDQLNSTYTMYMEWWENWFPKYQTWRRNEVKSQVNQNGDFYSWNVQDDVSKTEIEATGEAYDQYGFAQGYAIGTAIAIFSEANAYMMSSLSSTFTLYKFVPSMQNISYLLPHYAAKGAAIGPYASTAPTSSLVGFYDASKMFGPTVVTDSPGHVVGVTGAAFNTVDRLQLQFRRGPGHHTGDSGGTPFNFPVPSNGWVSSFAGGFVFELLAYVEVGFSEPGPNNTFIGTRSARAGDRVGSINNFNISMGPSFALVALGQGDGFGPGDTMGTSVITFHFMFQPVLQFNGIALVSACSDNGIAAECPRELSEGCCNIGHRCARSTSSCNGTAVEKFRCIERK